MKKYRKTMIVKIHNIDQSQPMIFDGVDNTYVKAGFFCIVRREKNEVQKFPLSRIFRVIEPYDPEDVALDIIGMFESEPE
jgi:hypothetical protein